MQNFSPNGQTVLKLVVLRSQKGVYLPIFRSKFKINYLGIFDWIFLHQVKKVIFIGPHAKF